MIQEHCLAYKRIESEEGKGGVLSVHLENERFRPGGIDYLLRYSGDRQETMGSKSLSWQLSKFKTNLGNLVRPCLKMYI